MAIRLQLTGFVPLLILSIAGGLLQGATIPGRWEKVESLAPGAPLIITLKSGATEAYRFKESDATSLAVYCIDGNELRLPKEAVAKIVKREEPSRKPDWIGAGVGAGGGVAIGLIISARFDETVFARADIMAPALGAIGAAVGAIIGSSVGKPREEVIYQAP